MKSSISRSPPRSSLSGMLGVFAEFETNLRHERQLEASPRPRPLASTRAGPSIDAARVAELKDKGMGPAEIARMLKIGRASVYRKLDELS
jgi:DNA invertase Pin-like site-specific DNA recombinase